MLLIEFSLKFTETRAGNMSNNQSSLALLFSVIRISHQSLDEVFRRVSFFITNDSYHKPFDVVVTSLRWIASDRMVSNPEHALSI